MRYPQKVKCLEEHKTQADIAKIAGTPASYVNKLIRRDEQLSELDDISYKTMMGEYIIYYKGKIVGGVYDERFLVKPVISAKEMMPDAEMDLPCDGAREMLLVENIEESMITSLCHQLIYPPHEAKFLSAQDYLFLVIYGLAIQKVSIASTPMRLFPSRNG